MKGKLLAVGAAFGAFLAAGPLQHFGVIPQTALGDASKALIKTALNISSTPAFASCRGGGGGGGGTGGDSVGGGGNPQGNNGFGNGGGDGVPGNSGFEDNDR